jgi:NADH-quinone oxidoreductase subunit E
MTREGAAEGGRHPERSEGTQRITNRRLPSLAFRIRENDLRLTVPCVFIYNYVFLLRQLLNAPDDISTLLLAFPRERDSLISILHKVQGKLGYLTPAALAEVAGYLNLSLSTIYSVATFYSHFRFKPSGRHQLRVCRGTACHVRGADEVLGELSHKLHLKAGETSKDGEYSLETEACFGSCALAPVVVKDGRVYGRMTPARVDEVLRGGP